MTYNTLKKIAPVFLLVSLMFYLSNWQTDLHRHQVNISDGEIRDISVQTLSNVPTSAPSLPYVPWTKENAIFPISFGLPANRFHLAREWKNHSKRRDFAHIIPGIKETYIYDTEREYYDGYSEAFYGITKKKAGWDCFRHYEIIASGSMPYFLDILTMPHNTMFDFPKSIVREAMALPGVPSEEVVKQHIANRSTAALSIDHKLFNATEYNRLMDALVEYATNHLTWSSKFAYMLSSIRRLYPCMVQELPRVLILTMDLCEYQSCVIFGGIYEMLGTDYMSSYFGPKPALFRSTSPPIHKLYGKGISYSNTYSDEWNLTEMDELTRTRLEEGFFNMIVYMNGGNRFCTMKKLFQYFRRDEAEAQLLVDYQKKHNPLVVAVDGNDIRGCHDVLQDDDDFEYHVLFSREFQVAKASRLSQWSGCNSTIP